MYRFIILTTADVEQKKRRTPSTRVPPPFRRLRERRAASSALALLVRPTVAKYGLRGAVKTHHQAGDMITGQRTGLYSTADTSNRRRRHMRVGRAAARTEALIPRVIVSVRVGLPVVQRVVGEVAGVTERLRARQDVLVHSSVGGSVTAILSFPLSVRAVTVAAPARVHLGEPLEAVVVANSSHVGGGWLHLHARFFGDRR